MVEDMAVMVDMEPEAVVEVVEDMGLEQMEETVVEVAVVIFPKEEMVELEVGEVVDMEKEAIINKMAGMVLVAGYMHMADLVSVLYSIMLKSL